MLGNPPTTLIYNRTETTKISVIGAFPRAIPKDSSSPVFCFSTPEECPLTAQIRSTITYFASAPIQDIILAKVFYPEGGSSCRGLLFTYRNGAHRALGDCRLGVDPCQTYTDPRFLHTFAVSDRLTYPSIELQLVRVRFSDESTQDDEEEGWSCYKMKGRLHLWFTHEECKLDVVLD